MLILSRKCGESIMIGDEIEIRVLAIGDGKTRLGITGPAWVPVHQRERYEARHFAQSARLLAAPEGIPTS